MRMSKFVLAGLLLAGCATESAPSAAEGLALDPASGFGQKQGALGCTTDAECDDFDACTGTETCSGGVCSMGTPLTCPHTNMCEAPPMCDPTSGMCVGGTPIPCGDGDACNGTETCDPATGCTMGNPVTCPHTNMCESPPMCDSTTGTCTGGTPIPCDDGDACNGTEGCDPTTGCTMGTPVTCTPGGGCNATGPEMCDPTTGGCVAMPGMGTNACDDFDMCTTDSCTENVCGGGPGCMVMPPTPGFPGYDITTCDASVGPGASCADIDALQSCLQAACIAGCGGTCSVVTTGNAWSCDGGAGSRSEGYYECSCVTAMPPPSPCSGGGAGCAPAGQPCGDADCNGSDDCDNSPTGDCDTPCITCTNTPVSCDDGNQCNGLETCDPSTGGCSAGMPLMCDDGDVCNGAESCDPATGCVNGTPLACDDMLWCNGTETCDSTSGCQNGMPPMCDNMDVCDGLETCNEMTDACDPGTALDCDDLKDCTDDMCDPTSGCSNLPNAMCPCNGTAPTKTLSVAKTVYDETYGCPLVGGSFGAKFDIKGSLSQTEAHCSNNCSSDASASLMAAGELQFCGKTLNVSAGASGAIKQKSCKYCDTALCEEKCDGQTCDTVEGGGSLSVGVSKFFGLEPTTGIGPVSIKFKCGATVSGTGTISGNMRDRKGDLSCASCVDCLSTNAQVTAAATADAGCVVEGKVAGYTATFGLPKIGTAGITGYGGVSGNISGDCPTGACPYVGAKANFNVNTPCLGFSFLFVSVGGQCYINASACGEANSCGTCTAECSNSCSSTVFNVGCNTCSP